MYLYSDSCVILLFQMDFSENPKQLAEWSELVQELDRVERAALGVDERGFVHVPDKGAGGAVPDGGGRKRANTFLARGLSLFWEKENKDKQSKSAGGAGTTSRPRSKSFFQQILGPIAAPSRRAGSRSDSDGSDGKAWGALAPAEQRAKLSSRPELDETRTVPRPLVEPSSTVVASDVTSPKPRRLQKKEKQLLAALAAHKRRGAGGSPGVPLQGEVGGSGGVQSSVAGRLHAAPPPHPEVVIPGPAAERLLLSLVRCRAALYSTNSAPSARELSWV